MEGQRKPPQWRACLSCLLSEKVYHMNTQISRRNAILGATTLAAASVLANEAPPSAQAAELQPQPLPPSPGCARENHRGVRRARGARCLFLGVATGEHFQPAAGL